MRDCADRDILPLRDNADKRAIADQMHIRKGALEGGLIKRFKTPPRGGWIERAPVQHARQFNVMNKAGTRSLGCEVDARHRRAGDTSLDGPLRSCVVENRRCQIDRRGERPVAEIRLAAVGDDTPLFDGETLRWGLQELGGFREKERPRRRCREANRAPTGLDGEAAGRAGFERTERRVARDERNAFRCNVQFVGCNLHKGGGDALADLDLSGLEHDHALAREIDPIAAARVVVQAGRRRDRTHARALPIAAARSIARRIRSCAPQRQR